MAWHERRQYTTLVQGQHEHPTQQHSSPPRSRTITPDPISARAYTCNMQAPLLVSEAQAGPTYAVAPAARPGCIQQETEKAPPRQPVSVTNKAPLGWCD